MSLMNPRGQTSSKKLEPNMPMPKASNVPQPRPPHQVPEPIYDEEVLRRYQRDLDRDKMLIQLESEREEWRRKYLTEKAERERLEMIRKQEAAAHELQLAKVCEERDAKIEKLEQARDDYRVKLKEFETECAVSSTNLLDMANSVAKTMQRLLDKIRTEHDEAPDIAGAVGLAAIANVIEQPTNEPLPKVVRDGPANEEETRRHE